MHSPSLQPPSEHSEKFVEWVTGFKSGDLLCLNNPKENDRCEFTISFYSNHKEEKRRQIIDNTIRADLTFAGLKEHFFYYYGNAIALVEPSVPIMYIGSYFPNYFDGDKSRVTIAEFYFLINDKKKILPISRPNCMGASIKVESVVSAIEKFGKIFKHASE